MKQFEFPYENLDVFQLSRALVKEVYGILRKFPKEERYALCDQLRRSVISVPSNIAEGLGRISVKERKHFLVIAFGSLMETHCQLQIACDLGYINDDELQKINGEIVRVAQMLIGLRKSVHKRIEQ